MDRFVHNGYAMVLNLDGAWVKHSDAQAAIDAATEADRMRLTGCLMVAEGSALSPKELAYIRDCQAVQAVQRLAAENARLRAVVEAARKYHAIASAPYDENRVGEFMELQAGLGAALSALDHQSPSKADPRVAVVDAARDLADAVKSNTWSHESIASIARAHAKFFSAVDGEEVR